MTSQRVTVSWAQPHEILTFFYLLFYYKFQVQIKFIALLIISERSNNAETCSKFLMSKLFMT